MGESPRGHQLTFRQSNAFWKDRGLRRGFFLCRADLATIKAASRNAIECKLDEKEKAQYSLTRALGLIWWLPDLTTLRTAAMALPASMFDHRAAA